MIKCLIYCTKSKDYHLDCEIVNGKKKWFCWDKKSHHYPFKYVKEELGKDYKETFNGHIVAQFDCENIIEFDTNGKRLGYAINLKPIIEKSCLSLEEMKKYIGDKKGYAIMIGHVWCKNLATILTELYPNLKAQGYSFLTLEELYNQLAK